MMKIRRFSIYVKRKEIKGSFMQCKEHNHNMIQNEIF